MAKGRNTIQKQLIRDAVLNLDSHPTADEILEEVRKKYPSVSRATIYNVLKSLSEDGKIKRIRIPDGPDRVDRRTDDHCHFRCIKCGRLFDVETGISEIIPRQDIICNEEQFEIEGCELFFYGTCRDCREKKE
jgi:Fe2+/Zn2+ uptake regulation proteins